MSPQEAEKLEQNIKFYRCLERRRDELQVAIDQITTVQLGDPNNTGPFTGNHRESRRVLSLHIIFSETRGKSPIVEKTLVQLGIEARLFGQALLVLLREKMEEVRNEMDKL